MSIQPSAAPHSQPTQVVQAGLTVRTTLRAGEGNAVDNIADTVQSWWQNLLNALPTGQATAPGATTPGQTSSQ